MMDETVGRFDVATIEPSELRDPHPTEWHDARQTGIGGSDISRILTGDALEVYHEKTRPYVDTGEVLDVDQFRGHTMEPLLRATFNAHTGRVVRRQGMRRHRDEPWAIVNPDGQVLATATEETAGMEIKAPRQRTYNQILEGGYRQKTMLQMQWGMHVTGYAKWYYMAGNLESTPPFILFTVEREEGLIAQIADVMRDFWLLHVEPRIPPDNEWFDFLGEDILEATNSLQIDQDILVDADFELEALGYAEARRNEKDGKVAKTEHRDVLAAHLNASGKKEIIAGRWKVSRVDVSDKEKFDADQLAQHRPLDRDAFVRWARELGGFGSAETIEKIAMELEMDLGHYTVLAPSAPHLNVKDLEGEL